MKKPIMPLTSISALLFSAVAGTQFINLGTANPYFFGGNTPPPADAQQPTIAIFYPENNTTFDSNNISLSFNMTMSKSTYMITTVWFEVDWQEGNTTVYRLDMSTADYIYDRSWITEFSYNKTLTEIPEGNHSIKVIAAAHGSYVRRMTSYHFDIGGFSSVKFTIDTNPPKISVLSIQNASYDVMDIDLNFSVSEPVSQITYSLDGQGNVTVAGNTTLADLSVGEHNVTVYAWDTTGNMGASPTATFTVAVPEPFPAVPVAAASVAAVAVVGVVLLFYFKKRKH